MQLSGLDEFNTYPPKQYINSYANAYQQIKDDLPRLVGDDNWTKIEANFESKLIGLGRAKNKQIRKSHSISLAKIFLRYPRAKSRIIFQVRTNYLANNAIKSITYLLTVPEEIKEKQIGKLERIKNLLDGLTERSKNVKSFERSLQLYKSDPKNFSIRQATTSELINLMKTDMEIYKFILKFSDTILPGKDRIEPPIDEL